MTGPTKVILYAIYAVIVVGLLTVIVSSFHSSKVSAPTQHSGSSSQPSNKGATSPSQAKQGTASGPSTNTSTQTQTATSGTGQQAQLKSGQTATTPANGQLNNTGPGDTIGLFAAATAAGVVGYRIVTVRKLKASKHL